MEAQSLSTCNQCGKKFQRKAHLLRHQQQHSGDRPYSCKFCSKTFKRSDVLRDHFSRCERRGNSAIPNSLERGRKRHACGECSRLKVKCDNNVPCRKCIEFGRKCVKSRATGASSPEETTTTPGPATPDTGSDRNSIGFLLNGSGETDFMREFPKSTTLSPNNHFSSLMPVAERIDPGIGDLSGPSPYQTFGHMPQGNNLDVLLSHLDFSNFEQRTHNWQLPGENLWPGPNDSLFVDRAAIDQRAFDSREKLKYTAATQNPPHLPSKELLEAIDFITAERLASFITLYFRHWHKHAPMIHEATFNLATAALPLVLALMSLGGMYSKDHEDVVKLKLILDTIEGFIFSIPGISEEYEMPGRTYVKQGENASPEWQQYQLEEIQGAYLIVVLQYWSGNTIARTRVRQQRFGRVVAIFHHLDLQAVQHSPTFSITDQLSFRTWIRKESSIRLATFAVMLDNAFGIFNNASPRFQWAEIDLPLQSDDGFFRLANYDAMLASNLKPILKMKIREAFLLLFSPPETEDANLDILKNGGLTALDMQMLIHILYTHLWSATFCNPLASLPSTSITALLAPFKTALSHWRHIWDFIKSSHPETEWNKLGYQRTAETYYHAVREVAEVFEKVGGRGELMTGITSDCEKGLGLRRILSF